MTIRVVLADERGAPLGVLAFEPHPQEFFRPSAESFRLTPFRAKAIARPRPGAQVPALAGRITRSLAAR